LFSNVKYVGQIKVMGCTVMVSM